MKNKLVDLRNHLFATLEALQDPDKPMEIDRARAISEVAQTVINTAKVELEFVELTGQKTEIEFLRDEIPKAPLLENGSRKQLRAVGK